VNSEVARKKQKLNGPENKSSDCGEKIAARRKMSVSGTAAHHRWKRKQVECKENHGPLITIDDTPDDISLISKKEESVLSTTDLQILKYNSGARAWLNGHLVNAAQQLLKGKFPNISGLQNVESLDTLLFHSVDGELVQILNCDNQNWVCISTIGCKPRVVKVYDRMRTGDLPIKTKEGIAAMLCTPRTHIYLIFSDVQQQKSGWDCGLYAIAYAYTLYNGDDPCKFLFDEHSLRGHFSLCLQQQEIKPFPCKRNLYNPGPDMRCVFRVYCSCRLPYTGDDMIKCERCKVWFHYTCVGLEPGSKFKGIWLCQCCM